MDYYLQILTNVGIFISLALSLNLINGLCGQFSLGHAGFWGIGAYSSAIYGIHLANPALPVWINLPIAMIVGFLASAICGLIVAVPCMRLRGDYLAIATIGFSEIFRVIIINTEFVGGPRGLIDIPKWTNIYWVWGFAFLVTFFMLRLKNSSTGRAIISIREDEIAAEAMGVNLFKYKLFSFVLGAAIAGMCGALVAFDQQFLHPSNFNFMWSVTIVVMVILGGMGSISGAIIGAIIITLFPEILKMIHPDLATWRMSLYSILIIFLMLKRPSGLLGTRELFDGRAFGKKLLGK